MLRNELQLSPVFQGVEPNDWPSVRAELARLRRVVSLLGQFANYTVRSFASVNPTPTTTDLDTHDETVLVGATAINAIAQLPTVAMAGAGATHTVKKMDATANTVTVRAAAGEAVDGVASPLGIVLAAQYQRVTVRCTGTTWVIID